MVDTCAFRRLELGPKDMANSSCVLVRRDNREKVSVTWDEMAEKVGCAYALSFEIIRMT